MANDADESATRQSSPRFPFIPLPKAVQRAQQIRESAGSNYLTPEQAREVWGYGSKSSGGDQTMAALGYYGLLEETGSGPTRRVKLTDLAIRYLREERPEARQEMASKMVQAPKAMQVLWGLWGHEPPNNPGIARSILKNDLNFSDSAAGQVLEVYRTNLQYFPQAASATIPENEKGAQEEKSMQPPLPEVDPSKGGTPFVLKPPPPGELQVLLTGQRLQITADVDLEGLRRLQTMLAKYEEILLLTQAH